MNPVERRYRAVLRLLPPSYRERWEDDMVDAFLTSIEPDDPEDAEFVAEYGRPSWSEVGSVLALAVRLRIGTPGAPPRYAAWSHAIRFATLALVLVHAVSAVIGLVLLLPVTGRIAGLVPNPGGYLVADRWNLVLTLTAFLWAPAYVALLAGRVRLVGVLAGAAVGGEVTAALADLVRGYPMTAQRGVGLLVGALILVALAAFGPHAPAIPARPWLVALPVAVAVQAVLLWLIWPTGEFAGVRLDWPDVASVAVVVAAAVHVAIGSMRRRPYWSHALALLAGTALAFRLASVVDTSTDVQALVELAVVALVTVVLSVRASRALRGRSSL